MEIWDGDSYERVEGITGRRIEEKNGSMYWRGWKRLSRVEGRKMEERRVEWFVLTGGREEDEEEEEEE